MEDLPLSAVYSEMTYLKLIQILSEVLNFSELEMLMLPQRLNISVFFEN